MSRARIARLIALVVLVAGWYLWTSLQPGTGAPSSSSGPSQAPASAPDTLRPSGEALILQLFRDGTSDTWVEGYGEVQRLLRDDLEGSRHQRFILGFPSGHTILVSHNITLAPRLDDLEVGDRVDFRGEYEWNERGGVVHWTHHDPRGRHAGGWLELAGRRYQ